MTLSLGIISSILIAGVFYSNMKNIALNQAIKYENRDYILSINAFYTANEVSGLDENELNQIKNIRINNKSAIKEVDGFKVLQGRMIINDRDKIRDLSFFKDLNTTGGEYTKKVLKWIFREDNGQYEVKSNIIGINDAYLNKIRNSLKFSDSDLEKFKNGQGAILYNAPNSKGQGVLNYKNKDIISFKHNIKYYENVAYQVDFGQAYETNTVTNFVPKVTPHKSNTNQEGISIDGKTVLPNTVNYYKIVLDYSQYKDMVVTDDVLAKGFYMVDDYPEEALTLNPDGIQVLDKDGNRVSGISVSTYASLSEAPKVVQDAMAKRQFTPKGAIQVLSSDDPKVFYDTYVKTGQTLVVTLPMTVKNELTKTGGQYENTAYQIDFGLAYVTETVVNNVPKLDPQKDVVIDLSHKDASLDGKEVALHQTFNYRLVGAMIPSNRATDLFEYGFEDNYDEKHDEYNGVYRSYLMTDVILKDGSVLKEGTEVTKYTLQQVDTENGLVSISFDKSFLETVSDDSAFQADVYLQMKRIAAGQVENTYLHTVNGYVISSNTVVTHTPQPEEPSPNQPTPPQPPIETIEPPVPASILPNTGEQESLLGLIGAGILLGTAYGLKKKEEK